MASVTRGEAGWQVDKTVLQCNKYMLETQIGTDVTFRLHSPDGAVVDLEAHKYMLVARSPVFEAMFCGSLTPSDSTDGKVEIKDVEPQAFREVLRFIYCEEATITTQTVMSILYAAKKYLLLSLATRCMDFLERNISVDNVCTILNHSLLYEESELSHKCFIFIGPRARQVLQSEGFLTLCRVALIKLLESDFLYVENEAEVFKACVRWAKEHGKGDNHEVTEADIRHVLGDAIHHIRFPRMDAREFAKTVGKSDILTDKEKADLYYYLLTSDTEGKPLEFTAKCRLQKCVRYPSTGNTQGWWTCNGPSEAIAFTVDAPIVLVGLALYGGRQPANHDVILELREASPDVVLTRCQRKVQSDGAQSPYPVFFDLNAKANSLAPGKSYVVVATMNGPLTFYGHCGTDTVKVDDITFQFSKTGKSGNGTNVKNGQIPELLFLPGSVKQ